MRISVVGATGRVGAKLARNLLKAGHQVRHCREVAPRAGREVELGAEPFLGSFVPERETLTGFQVPMLRS